MEVLLPRALKPGDRVAVVSPAGPLKDREALERGLDRLRRWKLEPVVGRHVMDNFGYLAGQDAVRAADLQAAINDPKLRAIFCTRGGYGITRLLERLDFTALKQDPKPIVGYSDITALLLAVRRTTGLIGFHGPMVATGKDWAFDARTEELQRSLLFDAPKERVFPLDPKEPPPHVMSAGVAEGPLVGGNLSLLAALVGTPWAAVTNGAIVVIEDTEEAPYRIDRLLTQLIQAGFFVGAAGIVLGDFNKSDAPAGTETTDLAWVLHDRLGGLRLPIAYGFPFGHRGRAWTLPIGARAVLNASDPARTPQLTLTQCPVQPRR